ncbi:unnamed protein product [Caretta caretta]
MAGGSCTKEQILELLILEQFLTILLEECRVMVHVKVDEVTSEKMLSSGALWESPGSQLEQPQPQSHHKCVFQEKVG